MDFFGHQDAARKRTKLLVVLYVLAVFLIISSISLLITVVFVYGKHSSDNEYYAEFKPFTVDMLWRPEMTLPIAGILLILIALGTVWKLFALRAGGAVVAQTLGGQLIQPNTTDPAQRRLLNIVEEMALASGMSVPPVYLLNQENGINAFAAGFTTSDAVIGVTKGCMELLTRSELQGVIAHEFSHILNGDMRLNIRLIGVLHGIVLIATTGYVLIRLTSRSYSRRYSSKKGGDPRAALFIIGAILYVLGYIGVFFGKLIKSAVSRQREYLADASAVQFTRDNSGISRALAKIGGLVYGSKLESSHAEEASHMFFSNGLSSGFVALLSTHPPLQDRIIRLDPSFKGEFPILDPSTSMAMDENESLSQFAGHAGGQIASDKTALTNSGTELSLNADSVKASIGNPSAEHLEYIQSVLSKTPEQLRNATHEPFSAGALVYTLLLDDSKKVRDRQLQGIGKLCEPHILQQVLRFEPDVDSLDYNCKLPLVDMCVPALKELSPEQFAEFEKCVQELIKADKSLSLFEYAVAHSVMSNLEWAFGKKKIRDQVTSLNSCKAELCLVLSTLSWLDTRASQTASAAFNAGKKLLGVDIQLMDKGSSDIKQLDAALAYLAGAEIRIREKIVEACIAVMLCDQVVTKSEAEILRAVCASLHCPIPPFVVTN